MVIRRATARTAPAPGRRRRRPRRSIRRTARRGSGRRVDRRARRVDHRGELRVDPHLQGVRQRVGDGFAQPGAGGFPDVDAEEVVAELVGAGDEFGDGPVHGPQPPAGGDRHVGDLGGRGRGGLHQADHVDVVLLAEVHRERRPAVDDGARRGQGLPAVQVTQRDVVRLGREGAGRHVVFEDRLRGPLAAAERAAGDGQVRHHHVDRVRGERFGQVGDAPRGPCRRSPWTSPTAWTRSAGRPAPRSAGTGTAAPRR